ncbi:hypothetical protein J3F83DRAFT_159549 [Trichoderma novae-zelandiae]
MPGSPPEAPGRLHWISRLQSTEDDIRDAGLQLSPDLTDANSMYCAVVVGFVTGIRSTEDGESSRASTMSFAFQAALQCVLSEDANHTMPLMSQPVEKRALSCLALSCLTLSQPLYAQVARLRYVPLLVPSQVCTTSIYGVRISPSGPMPLFPARICTSCVYAYMSRSCSHLYSIGNCHFTVDVESGEQRNYENSATPTCRYAQARASSDGVEEKLLETSLSTYRTPAVPTAGRNATACTEAHCSSCDSRVLVILVVCGATVDAHDGAHMTLPCTSYSPSCSRLVQRLLASGVSDLHPSPPATIRSTTFGICPGSNLGPLYQHDVMDQHLGTYVVASLSLDLAGTVKLLKLILKQLFY